MMPKRRVTWFVLADGSRARVLTRRQKEPGIEVVEEHDDPAARLPTREIGSDRPGRVQESANSAHHAVEAHHDAHRERKTAFARQLADRLNAASAAGTFDGLVLLPRRVRWPRCAKRSTKQRAGRSRPNSPRISPGSRSPSCRGISTRYPERLFGLDELLIVAALSIAPLHRHPGDAVGKLVDNALLQ
jgi:protein required for attachment to host cells